MEFNELRAAKYKDQGNTGGWTPDDVITMLLEAFLEGQQTRG